LEVGVEISIGAVLQAKDDVVFGLEGVEKIDQILMFYGEEDVLLVLQHLHLLCCGYRILSDKF
jgi:hypothetical protein